MFVQSIAFICAHSGGNGNGRGDIGIYGQQSNYTTLWRAKMKQLVEELQAQWAEGAQLSDTIAANLKALGFGDD